MRSEPLHKSIHSNSRIRKT